MCLKRSIRVVFYEDVWWIFKFVNLGFNLSCFASSQTKLQQRCFDLEHSCCFSLYISALFSIISIIVYWKYKLFEEYHVSLEYKQKLVCFSYLNIFIRRFLYYCIEGMFFLDQILFTQSFYSIESFNVKWLVFKKSIA